MTDKKYYIRIASLTLRVEDKDGNPMLNEDGTVKEFYARERNRSDNLLVVHEEIDRFLENLTLEDVTENPDD
ncbi:MAG: hypothetical protein CML19_11575 [Pusillimonas sp.]|nr:hypothetical protein [Pusillimonas sp.]